MKKLFPYFIISFILIGCPAPKPIQKETLPIPIEKKPLVPDMTIKVASLNLAKYSKKIEKVDIQNFATQLKKDSIDILALQSITRYPNLINRADIVDELAFTTEMRKVFGETITLSGRQNGNAVFSVYPIRSSENRPYDRLHSSNFEAALQAIIDCGVREVVVISTSIPEKASQDDQSIVATTLGAFNNFYIEHPIIISGNLPKSDNLRAIAMYDIASQLRSDDTPHVWFSSNGSLKLTSQKTERTIFGPMSIVRFGIFRQK